MVIALAVGEVAWDDGYITLAFSRTFAETGHIGLTPFSETVEGATSPIWFLMMAGIYKLGITSFYGFHLASQLVAALCAAGTAVLLYRLIRPSIPAAAAWWISFLVLVLGPFRTETANGMEMTLLCLVVLGMMNLLRDRGNQPLWGLAALAAAVPLIRLEAAGYVIAGALAIIVLSRQVRVGVAIIVSTLLSILLLTCARYIVFGTIGLTNTMIAKQVSPYSPPFGSSAWNIQFLVSVLVEPVATVLPAVVVAFVLSRISGIRIINSFRQLAPLAISRELPMRISFGIAYASAYFLFLIVFGSNYFAPPGRMGASAMLALIVVTAIVMTAQGQVRQFTRRALSTVLALFFLTPFLGVFSQDVAWVYLARLNTDPELAFNSTVAYRLNGEAAEHVRQLLQQPKVSVLLADVGAPSLCCDRLEVLDLGLLANTELAKSGWPGFAEYLRSKRPDLIQTHGVWSQESEIYENSQFKSDYTPVVVYESLFYMRNDLLEKLQARCTDADTSGLYFYAGLEPASSRKDAEDAKTIDKTYLDSLDLASLCRLA